MPQTEQGELQTNEYVAEQDIQQIMSKINKVKEKTQFVKLKHEFRQKLILSNVKKLKIELKERKLVLQDI